MPLPPLTRLGDLPIGVHQARVREVLDRFGTGSPQRTAIGGRLERIFRLAHSTGELARFVVFGSFVTSKLDPNDVDIVLLMEDSFDLSAITGEAALIFEHLS